MVSQGLFGVADLHSLFVLTGIIAGSNRVDGVVSEERPITVSKTSSLTVGYSLTQGLFLLGYVAQSLSQAIIGSDNQLESSRAAETSVNSLE